MNFSSINKTWTLFLDRDGVINEEKKNEYVLNRDEFIFFPNVKDAMKIFANIFGLIIIVTNQRGIGKGLMTIEDLDDIHDYMLKDIETAGGRIDKILYAPDLDNNSINRKPNHGMALQARQLFPQLDFSKALIAGNKLSDMQFGRNAGVITIFIATTNPEIKFPHPMIDVRFDSLAEFALHIENEMSRHAKE